ncbi:MAG: UbiD family decarboxylase [Chloroflexi bacterium]|nr:UbiD family decarboxylase [Chloroflexota bacterium]
MTVDLRDWLSKVEQAGELKPITNVDWDLELGAISRMVSFESQRRPAVLYDEIKGYPKGYRVLAGMLGTLKRTALCTRLPDEEGEQGYIQALRQKLKNLRPIAPIKVKGGPVLENVHTGEEVDLWEFPVPRWDDLDGGRYIGTGDAVITRDADGGWVNLGTYRVMVYDKNTLAIFMDAGKHGRIHRDKYFEQGKPCPISISFGHHPILFVVASNEMPFTFTEYDVAGGIMGEPIEVIEGEFTGLPFPATAEIVIEGESIPGDMVMEGPFSEWPRHYGTARLEPAIRVKRVLHRNNPILCSQHGHGSAVGLRAALLWNEMERAGVPDLRGINCLKNRVGGRFITIISIKQRYAGHAKHAALAAISSRVGNYMGKYIIIVDDDIDPTNIDEVLWAVGTRSDPQRSIDIIRDCWDSLSLDPAVHPDEKGLNSKAIIDACRPYQWIDRFPPVVKVNPEMHQKVLNKWGRAILD